MIRIVGISGSLRKGSFNSALLRAAASSVPTGVDIHIEPIDAIPLYSEDLEQVAFPQAVTRIKNALASADGLLMATPEYNHSLPGVLKNAVDWISRPPSDIPRTLAGLPVALMGASPGGFGTVSAQAAWLPVLANLGMYAWSGRSLAVSRAHLAFDSAGSLVDGDVARNLEQFLRGFAGFVSRVRGGKSA
jgi:NAD(P)H-dependent FMN reductase